MKTKVLVTGSNGMLGATLVDKLLKRPDVELYAISRGINRNPNKMGYLYKSIDITDFKALEELFDKYKFDVVINTAAMTNVDKCELNPEECWKVNVEAVEHIAELSKLHNSYLIHISTDFVFDGKDGPYKETDKPNPISVYGKSKYEAEKRVLALNFPSAILRTILVYGVVPSASRSNIVLWVKEKLEKGEPIRVVTDQYRTPTLVDDLANACISAMRRNATGIYHISGKDFMSIYELALKVADFWNLNKDLITPITSEELNQPAKRPPKTGFILMKAQTELEYQPHSFHQGLEIVDMKLKKLSQNV